MKKAVLFIACGLFIGSAVTAQNKLGYVDSRELLSLMPEMKKADSSLQVFAKSYQDELDAMGKEYQKKVQEYQDQSKTMSDAVKEVKEKELMDLQSRIQSTQQSAQDKVAKKKDEMYSPILERADKAIKEVAKANNYDYIFDASGGILLFAKDGDNILPLVKSKLGIK